MADNDYQMDSVGEVYAQALINMAQKQEGGSVLEQVGEDVRSLRELFMARPELAQFVDAATISDDEKIAALSKIFAGRIHPLTLETLKAMARRGRMICLPGFFRAYDAVIAKLEGRVGVDLVTASELAPEVMERIEAGVARALGKTPVMKVKTDAGLIGGIRLHVGDTLIDASVETQLRHMKEQLTRSGNKQLEKKLGAVVE